MPGIILLVHSLRNTKPHGQNYLIHAGHCHTGVGAKLCQVYLLHQGLPLTDSHLRTRFPKNPKCFERRFITIFPVTTGNLSWAATDVHEEPWGNNKIQRGGTQQAGHKQEQSKPEDEVVHVKISSFQEPCASLHLSALSQRLLALVGFGGSWKTGPPKETRCCQGAAWQCLAAAGQKGCLCHCCPKFSREWGL